MPRVPVSRGRVIARLRTQLDGAAFEKNLSVNRKRAERANKRGSGIKGTTGGRERKCKSGRKMFTEISRCGQSFYTSARPLFEFNLSGVTLKGRPDHSLCHLREDEVHAARIPRNWLSEAGHRNLAPNSRQCWHVPLRNPANL